MHERSSERAAPRGGKLAARAVRRGPGLSVFQVVTAAFPLISTQVLRAMHVGLLLLVVYISYPAFGIRRPWQPLAWLLGMAGLGTAVYQWVSRPT